MIKKMQVADTQYGGAKRFAFEYEEELSAIGNGSSVLMPDDISSVAVTLSFTGGASGYVEASTDKIEIIENDTAVWIIWDLGEVSTDSQDKAVPPSAIRMVQTGAGTMKMSVRAQ